MGNPHRTKSACILSRAPHSKKIIKPVIRVVQIHNPVYVQTDAINFPSLVQQLTGMKTRLPISHHQPAAHQPRRSAHHFSDFDHTHTIRDEICRWSSSAGDFNRSEYASCDRGGNESICRCSSAGASPAADEIFDWKNSGSSVQPRSSRHCAKSWSGLQNDASSSYEASSPNYTASGSTSEGYHSDREYGDALSNMTTIGVQRFSELDIWAGLASDHALPDITMLPPLLL